MSDFSTREPLATYDQAIWRLSALFERTIDADVLDPAIQIVADIFWFSDLKVRQDIQKACRALRQPLPVTAPPRNRGGSLW